MQTQVAQVSIPPTTHTLQTALQTATPARHNQAPGNLHITSPLLPSFIINDTQKELTMQVITEKKWTGYVLESRAHQFHRYQNQSHLGFHYNQFYALTRKINLCPLMKLQRIINLAVGRAGGRFFQGKGDNIPWNSPHMELQLLLFHPCYSTPSGEGWGITAGCFQVLNISQHKYLTAPTYEINSSASAWSHTDPAWCWEHKLKPLNLHRAQGAARQWSHCSAPPSKSQRVHTHPFPANTVQVLIAGWQ